MLIAVENINIKRWVGHPLLKGGWGTHCCARPMTAEGTAAMGTRAPTLGDSSRGRPGHEDANNAAPAHVRGPMSSSNALTLPGSSQTQTDGATAGHARPASGYRLKLLTQPILREKTCHVIPQTRNLSGLRRACVASHSTRTQRA